jgi:hypothetical protein
LQEQTLIFKRSGYTKKENGISGGSSKLIETVPFSNKEFGDLLLEDFGSINSIN